MSSAFAEQRQQRGPWPLAPNPIERQCPCCAGPLFDGDGPGVCFLFYDCPKGFVTLGCLRRSRVAQARLADYALAAMRGLVPFYQLRDVLGNLGVCMALMDRETGRKRLFMDITRQAPAGRAYGGWR